MFHVCDATSRFVTSILRSDQAIRFLSVDSDDLLTFNRRMDHTVLCLALQPFIWIDRAAPSLWRSYDGERAEYHGRPIRLRPQFRLARATLCDQLVAFLFPSWNYLSNVFNILAGN